MINFYRYYNGVLDKQHYAPLIDQLMRSRWSKELKPIEHIIKVIPKYAYRYARHLLNCRWLEAEDIIKQEPVYAYWYAHHVIKGRWIEAEPYIMKKPFCAGWYTCYVIKGRWPEAEEYIKQDEMLWQQYCKEYGIEDSVNNGLNYDKFSCSL
jgi:hypothetical protein